MNLLVSLICVVTEEVLEEPHRTRSPALFLNIITWFHKYILNKALTVKSVLKSRS